MSPSEEVKFSNVRELYLRKYGKFCEPTDINFGLSFCDVSSLAGIFLLAIVGQILLEGKHIFGKLLA